ncbi:hypothetical protein CREGCYN_00720 [Synechococcus sp. M16CYN]
MVLLTAGLLALAAVELLPLLIVQLSQLISTGPSLLTAAEQGINQAQAWATSYGLPTDFVGFSSDLATQVGWVATQLSQRLLGILGATVSIAIDMVIVLALAVFLLLGAEPITADLIR